MHGNPGPKWGTRAQSGYLREIVTWVHLSKMFARISADFGTFVSIFDNFLTYFLKINKIMLKKFVF